MKKNILDQLKDVKKIFWIDSSYKGLDAGLNLSNLEECKNWQNYWQNNLTDPFDIIVKILFFFFYI